MKVHSELYQTFRFSFFVALFLSTNFIRFFASVTNKLLKLFSKTLNSSGEALGLLGSVVSKCFLLSALINLLLFV